jgi:hypothetical protein
VDRLAAAAWGAALANMLTLESPTQTQRVRGWIATVAGAATLAFNAAKPIPVGPLSGLVPNARHRRRRDE